ncbi:hypothetical protein CAEBREN_09818 [Caenorhabditis brenneri]|uniref:Uncharacterized protein n=1 Tax=Caenorhabditis brenneri TaxID=135651 RepID=G0N470_CAEBE|nr:hypothetical protein CAEBREN_09818 [Caenorhabditis brenneri]
MTSWFGRPENPVGILANGTADVLIVLCTWDAKNFDSALSVFLQNLPFTICLLYAALSISCPPFARQVLSVAERVSKLLKWPIAKLLKIILSETEEGEGEEEEVEREVEGEGEEEEVEREVEGEGEGDVEREGEGGGERGGEGENFADFHDAYSEFEVFEPENNVNNGIVVEQDESTISRRERMMLASV